MDGRNPAPPKNPWNDDSLANANKQGFPVVLKWCRMLSTHSRSSQSTKSPPPPPRPRPIYPPLCFRQRTAAIGRPRRAWRSHCPRGCHHSGPSTLPQRLWLQVTLKFQGSLDFPVKKSSNPEVPEREMEENLETGLPVFRSPAKS